MLILRRKEFRLQTTSGFSVPTAVAPQSRTRPIRHDGVDKVTGRALYGADFHIAGMLHGAVLRGPHAHARIISIDGSRTVAHPGVKAMVTAKDFSPPEDKTAVFGGMAIRMKGLCENILATDKALYKRHAIAAVNPHIAEEALGLMSSISCR